MSVLIEDSPRNLLTWIRRSVEENLARGAVITPFATPRGDGFPYRRGGPAMAAELHGLEAEVWFDATTHAMQMANVGDFRYYDDYDLWEGDPGDLSSAILMEGHLWRVVRVQDELGSPHLAPTILLHHGVSPTSQQALDLSTAAVSIAEDPWLSIAGTSPFWSSGSALDSHIGALAQLEPCGWFLTVARTMATIPVAGSAEEVAGLCRTVRALSEYAPVFISHGDLAALPAVAAGATSIGTGWDQRQRVCAFSSYTARDPGADGGGWYERPTLAGLLGSLKRNEADVLQRRDPDLANHLGPLPAPGPQEAFLNHAAVLSDLVTRLSAMDPQTRYADLCASYGRAAGQWPQVVDLTGSLLGEQDWVVPFEQGLRVYGAEEGW